MSQPEPHAFSYPALHPAKDSLRLLEILPGSGTIKCKLTTATFQTKPQYQALSYEWGQNTELEAIQVNGLAFKVRRNLWHALHALRCDQEARSFWIDAVCINQDDIDEKNRQVPLMTFIYKRASQVVIWLKLHEAYARFDPLSGGTRPVVQQRDLYRTPVSQDHDFGDGPTLLNEIVDAEYWKRTWIIQELCVAQEISFCTCAGILPWDSFYEILEGERKGMQAAASRRAERISGIARMRTDKFRYGHIYLLNQLVSDFRDTFCQNPRDKVYAFISMSDNHLGDPIPIDYGKPLRETYTELVLSMNKSDLDPVQVQVETVFMSALLRQLLTREAHPVTQERTFERLVRLEQGIIRVPERVEKPSMSWLASNPEDMSLWLASSPPSESGSFAPLVNPVITVVGQMAGQIIHIGPTVEDVIGSSLQENAWTAAFLRKAQSASSSKLLSALNGRFLNYLVSTAADQTIKNIVDFTIPGGLTDQQSSPNLFIFKYENNLGVGITSSAAEVGDHLARFWNTSAVAVSHDPLAFRGFQISGRAAVMIREDKEWNVPTRLNEFLSPHSSRAEVPLNIDMLTRLTLNTVELPAGE